MSRSSNARYRSRSEEGPTALEVSFLGATELGEGNPRRTNVVVTASRRVDHAPAGWVDLWTLKCGHPKMPDGPWHGFQLTAIVGDGLFAAWGDQLARLSDENGDVIWRVSSGNTPIVQVVAVGELLVVRNGTYRFNDPGGLSNLCALTLDGEISWRAELPADNDGYSNWVTCADAVLETTSSGGVECKISARDGSILGSQWTR